jgi:hypothetical protein
MIPGIEQCPAQRRGSFFQPSPKSRNPLLEIKLVEAGVGNRSFFLVVAS